MARKKEFKINLQDLRNAELILEELRQLEGFEEIEIDTLSIVGRHKYEPKIKELGKIIKKIGRYLEINGNQKLTKTRICEIAGIARPTLYKLEEVYNLDFAYLGCDLNEIGRYLNKTKQYHWLSNCELCEYRPKDIDHSRVYDIASTEEIMKLCLSQNMVEKGCISFNKRQNCGIICRTDRYLMGLEYSQREFHLGSSENTKKIDLEYFYLQLKKKSEKN